MLAQWGNWRFCVVPQEQQPTSWGKNWNWNPQNYT